MMKVILKQLAVVRREMKDDFHSLKGGIEEIFSRDKTAATHTPAAREESQNSLSRSSSSTRRKSLSRTLSLTRRSAVGDSSADPEVSRSLTRRRTRKVKVGGHSQDEKDQKNEGSVPKS